MTFTLPEELAAQLVRKVPAQERSRYLGEALAQKLSERDRRLISACQTANEDPEVNAVEKEFDAISAEVTAPGAGIKTRRGVVGASRSHTRRRN